MNNNYQFQAAIIGQDSVPRGRGKLSFLKELAERVEPGQAIRLVFPANIPRSTVRNTWAQLTRKMGKGKPHSQIYANGSDSYVAYLFVGELSRRSIKIG